MVYEEFADTAPFFSELDTRLSHLHPVELLFPQSISKSLERSLEDWRRSRYNYVHCTCVQGMINFRISAAFC